MSELCEPCGTCPRCRRRMTAIVDAQRFRKLLRDAREAVQSELYAAGESEVRSHPALRAKQRLVDRIDAALARVRP